MVGARGRVLASAPARRGVPYVDASRPLASHPHPRARADPDERGGFATTSSRAFSCTSATVGPEARVNGSRWSRERLFTHADPTSLASGNGLLAAATG